MNIFCKYLQQLSWTESGVNHNKNDTSVLSDSFVATAINQNKKLIQIAQSNTNFYALPVEIASQYKWKKKSGLDVETIYFQACQAMDNPASDADIIWTKEQFATIMGYKDPS